MTFIEFTTAALRAGLMVMLYFIIGFGPGFIIGLTLANRYKGGKKYALRIDRHIEQVKKAAAHNAQWHPDHERWK